MKRAHLPVKPDDKWLNLWILALHILSEHGQNLKRLQLTVRKQDIVFTHLLKRCSNIEFLNIEVAFASRTNPKFDMMDYIRHFDWINNFKSLKSLGLFKFNAAPYVAGQVLCQQDIRLKEITFPITCVDLSYNFLPALESNIYLQSLVIEQHYPSQGAAAFQSIMRALPISGSIRCLRICISDFRESYLFDAVERLENLEYLEITSG